MQQRRRPWFKLSATFFSEKRIRLAGCAAVFPWVIAKLKQAHGAADDDDLDPDCCAIDLGIPADVARTQIGNMAKNGLLRRSDDGLWRDPCWEEMQADPRVAGRKRKAGTSAEPTAPDELSWPPYRHADDSGSPPSVPPEEAEQEAPVRAMERDSRNNIDADLSLGHPRARREVRVESRDQTTTNTRSEGSDVSRVSGPPMMIPPVPGSGTLWFQKYVSKNTGLELPTYRTGAAGQRLWSSGTLMQIFRHLWPEDIAWRGMETPMARKLWAFTTDLTERLSPEIIDRALMAMAPHGFLLHPDQWKRPYAIEAVIDGRATTSQQPQTRSGQRSRQQHGDVRAEAQAKQMERLRTDDDELHELAKDFLETNEVPSEQFRILIVDFYQRKKWPVPDLFLAPGGA